MNPVAAWVLSVALSIAVILGSLGFVLFCAAGVCHGAWIFLRTIWPHDRCRHVARGFDVLPVKVTPLPRGAVEATPTPACITARLQAGQK